MKLSLDGHGVCPPAISTMLSFAVMGTIFQSLVYNTLIKDMYHIYTGKSPPGRSNGIAPGLVWAVGRESLAMGGGLILGPVVKELMLSRMQEHGVDVPGKTLVSFVGGFISG